MKKVTAYQAYNGRLFETITYFCNRIRKTTN